MPTEKPKISAYVPQVLFDRFKKYQEESNLSMSQAVIVLLAQHFGIEQTIKGTTKEITVGGVTLARVEAIENQLKKLTELVEHLKTTNELLINDQPKIEVEIEEKEKSSQLNLLSEPPKSLEPIRGNLLAKRLGVAKDTPSGYKKKYPEKFYQWSREKDFDGIGWRFENEGYIPADELPSDLLNRLQKWILRNG